MESTISRRVNSIYFTDFFYNRIGTNIYLTAGWTSSSIFWLPQSSNEVCVSSNIVDDFIHIDWGIGEYMTTHTDLGLPNLGSNFKPNYNWNQCIDFVTMQFCTTWKAYNIMLIHTATTAPIWLGRKRTLFISETSEALLYNQCTWIILGWELERISTPARFV